MEHLKEYAYKPRTGLMLGASLLFAVFCAGFVYAALTNDRGLIINGIITLSEDGATVFYWVMAAVSSVFVLGGLWALITGLTSGRKLTITESGVRAPKSGYSRQFVTVKFVDIFKVTIQAVHKQRFLTLHHRNGNLSIAQSMLPDSEAFEEVMRVVAQRVEPHKGIGR